MYKLDPPIELTIDVYRKCISKVKNVDLKARLVSCEDVIVSDSEEFKEKIYSATLHTIPHQNNVGGTVTRKEMNNVYTNRMAKKKAPGREIYDKLLISPPYSRCPLCGQRTVSTLDHYLPKTAYPSLSVTPINLVPACQDCNKIKSNLLPVNVNKTPIHPYFDSIDQVQWLQAEVIESAPPSISYLVHAPTDWNEVLAIRIKFHFKALELAKLYTAHAGAELININYRLNELFKLTGPQGVRNYLLENEKTYEAANKNSWQTAMYRALSRSNWFFSGGFKT